MYESVHFTSEEQHELKRTLLAAESGYFTHFASQLDDRTEATACAAVLEKISSDVQQREQIVRATQLLVDYCEAADCNLESPTFEQCKEELLLWRVEGHAL